MASPKSTASARKIANYTQSISSGVTNLLTELGRVNGDDCSDNAAILTQLQTLTTLVRDMGTRLTGVEKSLEGLHTGSRPEMIEIEPPGDLYMPDLDPKEHNARARRYNHALQYGNDVLMPLRTELNTVVVGFPATLGHLISLNYLVENLLQRSFGLSSEPNSLWTFIGIDPERRYLAEHYTTGELLAEVRADKRAQRDSDIARAGPATAASRQAAAAHNRIARKKNATTEDVLMPIHDKHNILVYGWPQTLERLVNPYRRWDVLYLLEEYGQSVEDKDGCLARWIKFVGVGEEQVYVDSGRQYGPYWLM